MKIPTTLALNLLLTLLITACGTSVNTPDISHNPDPKMGYEITLTIKDAPGSFDSIDAAALYDVANNECSPFDKFIGIHRHPPTQDIHLPVIPMSDHEYTATAYLDLLKDEDYYDLGVCHWTMDRVIFRLKAGNAEFVASILRNNIISQQPATIYLLKQAYVDRATDSRPGNSTLLNDVVKRHPELFFPVTIVARESFQ